METPGQYPKKVCLGLWGQDKIEKYNVSEGMEMTASIEIESREYDNRWYTEVRAWKLSWDEAGAKKAVKGEAAKSDEPEPELLLLLAPWKSCALSRLLWTTDAALRNSLE